MKKRNKVIIVVIGIICALAVGMFISVGRSAKDAASNIAIQNINATGTADGVYEGHYEITPVKVSVRVSVSNEKITDIIILEHETGFGGKAEIIINDVIDQQSLDVDTISSATVSSKAILKAVEDALQSGR